MIANLFYSILTWIKKRKFKKMPRLILTKFLLQVGQMFLDIGEAYLKI